MVHEKGNDDSLTEANYQVQIILNSKKCVTLLLTFLTRNILFRNIVKIKNIEN